MSDYATLCDDTGPLAGMIAGDAGQFRMLVVSSIMAIPFGLPLFFYSVMWYHRDSIMQEGSVTRASFNIFVLVSMLAR